MADSTFTEPTPLDGSLDRMLSILNLFSEAKSIVTHDDVVSSLSCSRATAYRYLKALATAGLIAPVHGGTYVVGSRVIELDRLLRLRDPILQAARPVMTELAHQIKINVMLCSYYGDKVMCADIEWPDNSYKSSYERGRPMPMFLGATAKAILAHLTPYQQRNLMLWHASEIQAAGLGANWNEFRDNLRRLRKQRVVVSHGEIDSGLIGIGAPVFNRERKVLGSLVAIAPDTKEGRERLPIVKQATLEAAEKISQGMGQSNDSVVSVRASWPRRVLA